MSDIIARGLADEAGKKVAAVEQSLVSVTTQLGEKATKTDIVPLANKAEKSEVIAVTNKVTVLDAKVNSQASGSPKGVYATAAALKAALPTGNSNIYVVTEDGKWYFWNGTAWTAGGIYTASTFTDDELYRMLKLPNPMIKKNATNGIVNGDFSNGLTGWSAPNGTLTTSNNTAFLKGDGLAVYPQMRRNTNFTYNLGDKIYVRADCKVTNSRATSIRYFLTAGAMTTLIKEAVNAPIANVTYSNSVIMEPTSGGLTSDVVHVFVSSLYGTAANSLDAVMEVKNVIVINLTTMYGKGNEPTNSEFDKILASNNVTYFEGTKSLQIGSSSGKVFSEVNNEMKLVPVSELVDVSKLVVPDTENLFVDKTVSGAVKETKQQLDAFKIPLEKSLKLKQVVDQSKDLLPVLNGIWYHTASTFSGWGGAIGNPTNFDSIVFKIRNRATNTGSVKKIRVTIYKFGYTGAILFDKTINTFDIKPGEERDIVFPLGLVFENTSQEPLWAMYRCDQLIDDYFGNTTVPLKLPDHGATGYVVDGRFDTGVYPIYDPNNLGSGKPVIYAANAETIYTATDKFLENIAIPTKPTYEPIRVVLPDKFSVVVGDTFQLFYRGIIEAVDPYLYDIKVTYTGNNGQTFPRYFELLPIAGDVGIHTLTITLLNSSGVEVGKGTTKIVIKAIGLPPATEETVLCVGDSLTGAGTWVKEAARRLHATNGTPKGNGLTNIKFVGTVSTTIEPAYVKWEGYGGWTWNSYISEPSVNTLDMYVYTSTHGKVAADQHSLWADASNNLWKLETIEATRLKFTRHNAHAGAVPSGSGTLTHNANATNKADIAYTSTSVAGGNPFWNNNTKKIDFLEYCTKNGISKIDHVYTLLTWNGLAPYLANAVDHISLITSAKKFVDRLHEQFPNAKVKIMGIQVPSLNGGMGTNYGSTGGYSHLYGNIRTVMGINLAYQAFANEAAYKDFVEFVNVSGQFDSENNMPIMQKQVNTRNTKTEVFGTNGVHPDASGYLQIGDAAYRNMVSSILK